jgi:hypothetical protein
MMLPPFRLQRRARATAGFLAGRPGKETLHFPLPVPARLAVMGVEFHMAANMKAFAIGDIAGLLDYAPDALALPSQEALSMADRKLRGSIELPSLRLAILVLSSVDVNDGQQFSSSDRDLLWTAFGLPVFEQLRGWNGRVVARECEVHDGLHFDANSVIADVHGQELFVTGRPVGFRAEIVTGHCECGVETPRLRWLAKPKSRAAAA